MKRVTDQRKLEHIDIIRNDPDVERRQNHFDQIRLRHRALPEISLADVDTSVEFMGKRLSMPLVISSMTGGDDDLLLSINRNLAAAAEAAGVAMAVGSQRVMFENSAARKSFDLRDIAPTTLLFGNLGAVQLNHGFGVKECQEAIDHLEADALYLHLNPLQEAVQPEGDTDFSGLAAKIGEVSAGISKPVILKEVGAGIGPADAELAREQGVKYIDVAGAGGTSWSRIEHHRGKGQSAGLLFQDWGIPTPLALEMLRPYRAEITLIASGGVRNGLDMVKSMVLGASLCGLAAPFLRAAMQSAEDVLSVINELKREFTIAMFLLGASSPRDLIDNRELIL